MTGWWIVPCDNLPKSGATLDLSVSGNRDLFGPDVDKGSDGSIPTGTAPDCYHTGETGTWHANAGTGGNATLYGTLTTAPSPPN